MASFPMILKPTAVKRTLIKKQLKSPFEKGYVISRAKHTRTRRQFELSWDSLSIREFYVLKAHFESNLGNTFFCSRYIISDPMGYKNTNVETLPNVWPSEKIIYGSNISVEGMPLTDNTYPPYYSDIDLMFDDEAATSSYLNFYSAELSQCYIKVDLGEMADVSAVEVTSNAQPVNIRAETTGEGVLAQANIDTSASPAITSLVFSQNQTLSNLYLIFEPYDALTADFTVENINVDAYRHNYWDNSDLLVQYSDGEIAYESASEGFYKVKVKLEEV